MKSWRILPAWWLAMSLVACGGGGGGSDGGGVGDPSPTPPPAVAAPAITTPPQSQTVNDGAAVSFTVSATGSGLSYQWLREGQPIAGATAATLGLAAVSLADQGARFSVQVSNAGGQVTSSAAVLGVAALAPTVTTAPQAQRVQAGATASFSVVASGSAPLSYQWLRNGAEIAGATSASYTTGVLGTADQGASYAVRVSNGAGSVTSAGALLTVEMPAPSTVGQRLSVGGLASYASSLVRSSSGQVWAWGGNFLVGKVGSGSTEPRTTPFQWPGITDAVAVSVGTGHSVVVRSGGNAVAAGSNAYGQLGTGGGAFSTTPVPVTVVNDFRGVAAAALHTIGLRRDGTVWQWGFLPGSTSATLQPAPVPGLSNVTQVCASASANYGLALTASGAVWFWGQDFTGGIAGQSFSVTTAVLTPLALKGLGEGVRQIACGHDFALALRDDGTVWISGKEPGIGLVRQPINHLTPTAITTINDVVWVSAGFDHALAVKRDGTVWAWGANGDGQLGLGNTTESPDPARVGTLSDVVEAAAGGDHSLFLRRDGSVWASGSNAVGQLGNPSVASGSLVPVQVPGLSLN